jgi:anti-anti-sigma regulatory factor
MRYYLIVANGKHKGLPIPIEGIDLFLIGTGPMCQMKLTPHPEFGEQHCAIVTRGKKVFIDALDNQRVTLVNGEPITGGSEWPLHPGDRLVVGPLELMVQFNERVLSKRDLDAWALRCLDVVKEQPKMPAGDFEEAAREASGDGPAKAAAAILSRLMGDRGENHGRVTIGRQDDVTVVRLNDTHLVDPADLKLLSKELHNHLSGSQQKVLLDFKHVKRMSSSAEAMLEELSSWLGRQGGRLALCRLRPDIRDMLRTFRAMRNAKIYDDKPAAIAARW